jgi:hypothetical protein
LVTTIQLSEQELADLKELTKQNDPEAAVRAAMQDYLRYARRMQLKQLSGQVQMQDNWQELEDAELDTKHDADRPGGH